MSTVLTPQIAEVNDGKSPSKTGGEGAVELLLVEMGMDGGPFGEEHGHTDIAHTDGHLDLPHSDVPQ